jgi:glutamine amidotransferase
MIKVLNYGSGNVHAILNIYKELNISCEQAFTPEEVLAASKIIVPGVGAFDQTISQLRASGMWEALEQVGVRERKPILGICVGMQILAESSEEGALTGLGWIPGKVLALDVSSIQHKPLRPHMGWNSIIPVVEHPIFNEIDFVRGFYFLHSYYYECANREHVLAMTEYGTAFAAAVVRDNIIGMQFHPEKSHLNGIKIFQNFASL